MKCRIHSLYLCVKDMQRAIAFYEDFFGVPPIEKDEIYSVFLIDGFRFGLFAHEKMKEHHCFGDNCLPSIEVENLTVLKEQLKKQKIVYPLTKVNHTWIAEFADSEGNHIEITAYEP